VARQAVQTRAKEIRSYRLAAPRLIRLDSNERLLDDELTDDYPFGRRTLPTPPTVRRGLMIWRAKPAHWRIRLCDKLLAASRLHENTTAGANKSSNGNSNGNRLIARLSGEQCVVLCNTRLVQSLRSPEWTTPKTLLPNCLSQTIFQRTNPHLPALALLTLSPQVAILR
jgi:hypothetical protein